jgi:hypothetical protein
MERLTANAIVATVLGSTIPASSDTAENKVHEKTTTKFPLFKTVHL